MPSRLSASTPFHGAESSLLFLTSKPELKGPQCNSQSGLLPASVSTISPGSLAVRRSPEPPCDKETVGCHGQDGAQWGVTVHTGLFTRANLPLGPLEKDFHQPYPTTKLKSLRGAEMRPVFPSFLLHRRKLYFRK